MSGRDRTHRPLLVLGLLVVALGPVQTGCGTVSLERRDRDAPPKPREIYFPFPEQFLLIEEGADGALTTQLLRLPSTSEVLVVSTGRWPPPDLDVQTDSEGYLTAVSGITLKGKDGGVDVGPPTCGPKAIESMPTKSGVYRLCRRGTVLAYQRVADRDRQKPPGDETRLSVRDVRFEPTDPTRPEVVDRISVVLDDKLSRESLHHEVWRFPLERGDRPDEHPATWMKKPTGEGFDLVVTEDSLGPVGRELENGPWGLLLVLRSSDPSDSWIRRYVYPTPEQLEAWRPRVDLDLVIAPSGRPTAIRLAQDRRRGSPVLPLKEELQRGSGRLILDGREWPEPVEIREGPRGPGGNRDEVLVLPASYETFELSLVPMNEARLRGAPVFVSGHAPSGSSPEPDAWDVAGILLTDRDLRMTVSDSGRCLAEEDVTPGDAGSWEEGTVACDRNGDLELVCEGTLAPDARTASLTLPCSGSCSQPRSPEEPCLEVEIRVP